MGMYSNFSDESLTITDLEGLKEFLKRWENNIGRNVDSNDNDMYLDIIKKDNNGDDYVTFEDWDDIKLISYWRTMDCLFLKCVAKYIEGDVNWDFENNDEAGWVEFKDKRCIMHTGQMNWQEWKPEQSIDEKELTDKQKEFMLVEEI